MPAQPADIARYTTDGVVITASDDELRQDHVEAIDGLNEPIEMFFDDVESGQTVLNERFSLLSRINAVHEGIEVEERLELGSEILLTPNVPSFRIIDPSRGIDKVARLRAFSYEAEMDRFSVEVVE